MTTPLNQNKGSASALSTLGKRIERLLYFGTLLLLAFFVQLYLVATVVSARSIDYSQITALAAKLETNIDKLSASFLAPKKVAPNTDLNARAAAVANTRKSLGLPPQTDKDTLSKTESYQSMLARLGREVALETGARPSAVDTAIDTSVSPEKLIASLRDKGKAMAATPVSVWGIETPTSLPFQYGNARYQVPTSFIANALLVALALTLLGWLGALYMTRQRELLNIRGLSDYRLAFPHVLNVLPLVPESFEEVRDRRFQNVRGKQRTRKFNRILFALIRSSIILMFIVPMLSIFTYSVFQLVLHSGDVSWGYFGLAVILLLWLTVQSLALIFQEWLMLWEKEFFV